MSRKAGIPNRNYPPHRLRDALKVPRTIQDEASGMEVSRLTLAEILKTTPGSSRFRALINAANAYGFIKGSKDSPKFSLTDLGNKATGENDDERSSALKAAVQRIAPFKLFFETFADKKIPGATPFKEFLVTSAKVPEEHAEACMAHILADAETAGLVREISGARYIDLVGTPAEDTDEPGMIEEGDLIREGAEGDDLEEVLARTRNGGEPQTPEPEKAEKGEPPSAIFVGGRKGKNLDQLTKILNEYKIPHKLAEDKANKGRPISQKVADIMRECGAAIIVFTPDEELRDLDGNPVFRPSENVVHELGAAGMEYGNRIVIFREESVTLASNYNDIGHISFKDGELSAKGIELFRELIEFGLVKVTVGV